MKSSRARHFIYVRLCKLQILALHQVEVKSDIPGWTQIHQDIFWHSDIFLAELIADLVASWMGKLSVCSIQRPLTGNMDQVSRSCDAKFHSLLPCQHFSLCVNLVQVGGVRPGKLSSLDKKQMFRLQSPPTWLGCYSCVHLAHLIASSLYYPNRPHNRSLLIKWPYVLIIQSDFSAPHAKNVSHIDSTSLCWSLQAVIKFLHCHICLDPLRHEADEQVSALFSYSHFNLCL